LQSKHLINKKEAKGFQFNMKYGCLVFCDIFKPQMNADKRRFAATDLFIMTVSDFRIFPQLCVF